MTLSASDESSSSEDTVSGRARIVRSRCNKHCFKSLFSCLFCVKYDLISQNRRLGLSEIRVRQVAFSVE